MIRTLRAGPCDYVLCEAFDSLPRGEPMQFADAHAAMELLARFLADPHSAMVLRELLEEDSLAPEVSRLDEQEMIELVAFRLARGSLRIAAVPLHLPSFGAQGEDRAAPATRPAKAREVASWIEIVLTDEADPPQPIAYAKYQLRLPDGTKREGILDERGRARLDGIDPGECQVTFPDFDGRAWA